MYLTKYSKYKNKYLELKNNLEGGVSDYDKNKPLFIYLLGQKKLSNDRGHICTLLDHINNIIRYSNISKNRINLIYGDNKSIIHTCEINDKPLPYGIDVNYIDKYDNNDFTELINTILENKTNSQTPIIFIFDGNDVGKSGEMVMHDSLIIDKNLFPTIQNNQKLFMNLKSFLIYKKHNTFGEMLIKFSNGGDFFIEDESQFEDLYGGVSEDDKDKPLFIYLLGEEKRVDKRGYICTSLIQIDNIIQYSGISENRINIIYGNNETDEHTCNINREYARPYLNKPLPYGIDVNYINDYDEDDFKKLIKKILENKTNHQTPIIFMFDGHGSENTGAMGMNRSLTIDSETIKDLFSTKQNNKKLFIFNQCFSYNMYELLVNKLVNSIYICSKNCPNKTSVGTGLFRRLKEFLDSKKYNTFNDMEIDFKEGDNFFIKDKERIQIQDIFKLYPHNKPVINVGNKPVINVGNKPVINVGMFKQNDQVYLIAEDDNKNVFYLGYNLTLKTPIIQNQSKWIIDKIEIIDSDYYFSFATTIDKTFDKTYLNNYEFYQQELQLSFTDTNTEKVFFKINSDFSLQSLNDNYYLLYDSSNNTFIRGQKIQTGKLHLVKVALFA
jgi:glutaredoxin